MPRASASGGRLFAAYAYPKKTLFSQARAALARARKVATGRGPAPYARARRRNPRTAGFLGIERKFYDTSLVDSALTAPTDATGGEHDPSATIVLNTVTQGDGESQRDGRKISMESIHVKGVIKCAPQVNQTAQDNACYIFMCLVLDTQTNGATISSEQVFLNPGNSAQLAATPMLNLQYQQRFKILATKKMLLRIPDSVYDGTNIEQAGLTQPFNLFSKLNGLQTNYTGTTETVANIADNSLHVVAFCSNPDLAPNINYNARLRFQG